MNIYLSPEGQGYDLEVTDAFNLRLTENNGEYVSQKIENNLKTFAEEWFLDFELGIPYYTRILIKQADPNDVNNIFLTAITDIPEIEKVLQFEVDYDNAKRLYSIKFKVQLTSGEIEERTVTI
jgi:hypothetical protein